MLNLLKLPHEGENLEVIVHHFLRENRRQWCQIVDSVVELEHFPAAVSLLVLKQFHVKPVQEFGSVELGIAGPDRGV